MDDELLQLPDASLVGRHDSRIRPDGPSGYVTVLLAVDELFITKTSLNNFEQADQAIQAKNGL